MDKGGWMAEHPFLAIVTLYASAMVGWVVVGGWPPDLFWSIATLFVAALIVLERKRPSWDRDPWNPDAKKPPAK